MRPSTQARRDSKAVRDGVDVVHDHSLWGEAWHRVPQVQCGNE